MKTLILTFFFLFSLNLFSQNYKIIKTNEKYGVADNTGKEILSVKYLEIKKCKYSPNHLIFSEEMSNFYLLNIKTNESHELLNNLFFEENYTFQENEISEYINDKLVFIEKGKKGLIKIPENIVIPAQYDMVYMLKYSKNTVLLLKKRLYRTIDILTKKKSPWFSVKNFNTLFEYDSEIEISKDVYFFAKIKNKQHIINLNGTFFPIEKFNKIPYSESILSDFDSNMILLTKQKNKFGFINNEGKLIIACIYDDADWTAWNNSIIKAKYNEKYGIIDKNNRILVPFVYDKINISKDKVKATFNKKSFIITDFGSETLFLSKKGNKWGYINNDDKVVIDYKL